MTTPWFDPNHGWILGPIIGVYGGALGPISGILAARGRAKSIVLGLYGLGFVGSVTLLILAIVAYFASQPNGVWFCLGLPGLIGTCVFGPLVPFVRQRYREAEARRIAAQDL
jgi:hypothetical protein